MGLENVYNIYMVNGLRLKMDELNSLCLFVFKYVCMNKFLGVFNNVIFWLILSDS